MFSFPKPDNWASLPLYTKLTIYKTCLDERFAPFVDKLEAKIQVKEICGDRIHVARVIRILDSPDDITEDDLRKQPTNCLIKATHGSGWNIRITPTLQLSVVQSKLHKWNTPYIGSNERHYQYVKPRFFIEECIHDAYHGQSGNAVVFMFRCIHGQPVTIGVKKGNIQNMYRITGECLEKAFSFTLPFHKLDDMKRIAVDLSKPFEFVRIDLYLGAKGEIYFSEYTFTPAGGIKLYTDEIEAELGALWN